MLVLVYEQWGPANYNMLESLRIYYDQALSWSILAICLTSDVCFFIRCLYMRLNSSYCKKIFFMWSVNLVWILAFKCSTQIIWLLFYKTSILVSGASLFVQNKLCLPNVTKDWIHFQWLKWLFVYIVFIL